MAHVNKDNLNKTAREPTRRALASEQVRMRHYRKALACVQDVALRRYWENELEACRGRAARLAIAMTEQGEPIPVSEDGVDSTHCLAQAMDMALSNGDMAAAEAVALECLKLVDMRCNLMHDERR